ncbi:MAG: RpiB/LacA/LacB family sugar-phosphate isomerase [Candidatus Doudnabacteria bacterium]|nr:RpiB/LacA/LacB family sugar-phosphate isomerase [Candidatus Doudnabacteria bacterium]
MLYLGADHNGYFLKERLKYHLARLRVRFFDCGARALKQGDDYVDFSNAVTAKIDRGDYGILVCGSGHGMVIAANKIPGIRAIMPLDPRSARFGRHDDHANVLVLAAWQMNLDAAKKIVRVFLTTKTGRAQRYIRRLNKIRKLEQ